MIAKSVRYSMIFLFCLSIFSHYYAWWAYVNYYNDDFYSQWNHQMFFTVNFSLWLWHIWKSSSFFCVFRFRFLYPFFFRLKKQRSMMYLVFIPNPLKRVALRWWPIHGMPLRNLWDNGGSLEIFNTLELSNVEFWYLQKNQILNIDKDHWTALWRRKKT